MYSSQISHCRRIFPIAFQLPEDIYKTHLETVRSTLNTSALDSARANLAASYVNGLVNCGFGKEKLLQGTSKNVPWLFKQKEFCKWWKLQVLELIYC